MRHAASSIADSIRTVAWRPARVSDLARAALLAAALLALTTSTASAVVIYPNVATFGTNGTSGTSFGSASQVALDQAGKRLYVLNTSPTPASIYGFDVSTPGTFTPLGGSPLITGLATPGTNPDIAVDNTGGGTTGRIYYVSQSAGTLSGFTSAGASLGAPFAPLTPPTPKTLCGAAVDSAGNIGIGNSNNTARNVLRYNSAGTAQTSISTTAQGGGPCKVAFDSNNDLYFALLNGATWRYTAVSGYSSASAKQFDPTATRALAVDRVTHNLYVLHSNKVNVWDSTGAAVAEFATGISTNFRGIAVNEATGAIYVSDLTANKLRVFTPVKAPVPTTGSYSNLLRNSVTLEGHVEPDGGGDVTECTFEYGTTTVYTLSKPCSAATPYSSGQDVSAGLIGLATDTLYHYRLVTANATANSKNVGADMTFTTPTAVAGVTTEDASDQTQTTAELHGTLIGDGLSTEYWFEWGPTSSYGNIVPGGPTSNVVGPVIASADIEGLSVYLSDSLPYHYRLVAENSTGKSLGPDKTFFTAPPDLPLISGTNVSNVTPTSAEVAASITPGGGATIYLFEYGLGTGYGTSTLISNSIGEDNTDHPISATLTGLNPGTIYHFRAVAINFGGTSHSADQTFVTPDLPRIESSGFTAVGQTTVRLSASVIGNASPTDVIFEYGTSSAYGQATGPAVVGDDLVSRPVGVEIGGLLPGTTYHFRAVATNGIGAASGPDLSFTTEPLPPSEANKERLKCKRSFVKRKGRCVKRRKHRRNQHRSQSTTRVRG